jgi:hypothetical protein
MPVKTGYNRIGGLSAVETGLPGKKARLKEADYLFLRSSYRFMVSASLLLSEIKRIVFPPSSMTGNLFCIDPVNSFACGTFI